MEIIVDNFAGGGGASTGIELATGRSVDIAINHDPAAIAMHKANHPLSEHYLEDVWAVDPVKAVRGRDVALCWFSPDCFPAGTLVLTKEGYKPIEKIKPGEEVLTHKQRWRKVTETSTTVKPLIKIKGHGHYGLIVSPEHPILARKRKNVWNNQRREYDITLEEKDWTPASILDKGWYWSSPTKFPELPIPQILGRGMEITPALMWLVGRYLGDGCLRFCGRRAELTITCGEHEIESLSNELKKWQSNNQFAGYNEFKWYERKTTTAYNFVTQHKGFVEWIKNNFSCGAGDKTLPTWALGMPEDFKLELLKGYISADGWCNKEIIECRTISKKLVFSMKALINSLGKPVTVYKMKNTDVIEGRKVNAKDIYMLRFRNHIDANHKQTFVENDLEWNPIRKQEYLNYIDTVYNIGVEEDESYIADGIISHNCKHFSKAKGGKPVEKNIRGLAWVAVKWASKVRPRVIMLENVEEFKTWGPLTKDGYPDPLRKGETFNEFVAALRKLDYKVEWRELKACDYGAPTIRKRFFLVARCDNKPIVWPRPTHGNPNSIEVKSGKLKPWRIAAEIIDWSIPCPSIFNRKKPLAENTLKRIAKGIQKFVIDNPVPFILQVNNINKPVRVTTSNSNILVTPYIAQIDNKGFGKDNTQRSIEEPLSTVMVKANNVLITPFLTTYHTETTLNEVRGDTLDIPIKTVDAANRYGLVSPFLTEFYGGFYEGAGADIENPIPTVTTKDRFGLVSAFISKSYAGESRSVASSVTEGVHTITARPCHALVEIELANEHNNHAEDVKSFLDEYYGKTVFGDKAKDTAFLTEYYSQSIGSDINNPLPTVTSKDRLGLVTIHGQNYEIVDIGMRMLEPHELFKAQGFPDDYIIDRDDLGNPYPKTAQVARCGNAVPPPFAEALVRANLPELCYNLSNKEVAAG